MKKIKIFLASSTELKPEREQFEIEIRRKNQAWSDREVFLHLDIWEDLSTRMSETGSQGEYNKRVEECDLFVLIAWKKMGIYTDEEFEKAFGQFIKTKKPVIFTYFKNNEDAESSLDKFKSKLNELKHFPSPFKDSNDLWNQFNKELEKLNLFSFEKNKTIPKFFGSSVFLPEVFIGRTEGLGIIHNKLFNEGNLLLLVNGDGGIGKTTIAAQYYHTYSKDYTHLAWVFAEPTFADAMLSFAVKLNISFPDISDKNERFQILLEAMRELKNPCLLVIDNANNLEELQKYYSEFRSCTNFHLLLTTRITEFETAQTFLIEPLTDENAKILFTKYYLQHDEKENDLLQILLNSIGKNTLVIELMAKNLANLNKLKTNYSLNNLIEDLKTKGLFGVQSNEVSSNYNVEKNIFRKEKPEAIIAAMYDLLKLSDDEQKLLSVFAVLPAENILFTNLELLLKGFKNFDVSLLTLAQKGWINKSVENKKTAYKTNPIIQAIVKNKHSSFVEDCKILIVNMIALIEVEGGTGHPTKVGYDDARIFIRYAEGIINLLNQKLNIVVRLAERIGKYFYFNSNLHKAIHYFEVSSRISYILISLDPQNQDFKKGLAKSCQYLGMTHSSLGDLNKTLSYYEEYSRIEKELLQNNPHNIYHKDGLAISYERIGSVYSLTGDIKKALYYFNEYARLEKELLRANPKHLGFMENLSIAYERLGETYTKLRNFKQALIYYEQDLQLTLELNKGNPQKLDFKNGLSVSYMKLGNTYTSLKNIAKALIYYQEYSRLKNELFEAHPKNVQFKNGLAISYEYLGDTFITLGDIRKGLDYYKKRLPISQELYEAHPDNVNLKYSLSIAYFKLGHTHVRMGNLNKAREYFEQDLKLIKELFETSPNNVEFKNGLLTVYYNLQVFHFKTPAKANEFNLLIKELITK